MRRVAAKLGAGTMTLYHYVQQGRAPGADVDAIMAELLIPDDELADNWRDALAADRASHATRSSTAPLELRPAGGRGRDVGGADRHAALRPVARASPRAPVLASDVQFEIVAFVDDWCSAT